MTEAAAQGCEFHQPLLSSTPLEAARALLRTRAPRLSDDRHFAPDMAEAAALARSGQLGASTARRLPDVAEAKQ